MTFDHSRNSNYDLLEFRCLIRFKKSLFSLRWVISRRSFLGLSAAGMAALGSYFYLNDQPMTPAPLRKGKLLCDLHVHFLNDDSLETIINVLSSPGVIGLAHRPGEKYHLNYEIALKRIRETRYTSQLEEITPGQLARLGRGYIVRTEEFVADVMFHFLAIGWEGDYFDDFQDPFATIEAVHRQNGLVVLNHPYSVDNGFQFRLPTAEQEEIIKRICQRVDLVEVHNAQNLRSYVPGMDNMHLANERAALLVAQKCYDSTLVHKPAAVASSDTHNRYEQVRIAGFYVPEESLTSMELLKETLVRGGLEMHTGYVSRWSFLQGAGIARIRKIMGL